jgi:hypothetical protein
MPPAPMDAWLDMLLETAKTVWSLPPEGWIDDAPSFKDTDLLEREEKGDSNIDKRNLRSEMVAAWRRGEAELKVRELPGRTRVVILGYPGTVEKIPWDLWSRIFQAIGHPVGYIIVYAHPQPREFPPTGQPAGAEHINGGYSYLCDQSLVVLYRLEEVTRVLLHELLHTACFDNDKKHHTPSLEANTEAWTEVFLGALLAKGSRTKFLSLWKKQCRWMEEQAVRLRDSHGVVDDSDYTWRYITGKLRVLEDLGFYIDCDKGQVPQPLSLRMTTPEWGLF